MKSLAAKFAAGNPAAFIEFVVRNAKTLADLAAALNTVVSGDTYQASNCRRPTGPLPSIARRSGPSLSAATRKMILIIMKGGIV